MSRSTAKRGASGVAGGSSLSRREQRRAERDAASRRYAGGSTHVSPAILPLLPLAIAAGGIPIFVWSALGDEIGMPRLAATFWLTGCSLVALSLAGAWSRLRWRALALPCAALVGVVVTSALATALAADPLRSLIGEYHRYQGLLPLLMYAALFLAAAAATAHAGTVRPLLIGAFIGGALSAAYGVIQWAGLDWVTWGGLPAGQIGGAVAQPETLGIGLVVAAAASTGLLPDVDRRWQAVVAGGIALMLFVTMLTLSRGAWVGAAAACAVLAALHIDLLRSWRSRWWYVLPAIAVVAVAVAVLPQGRDTLGRGWHRIGSARNFTDTSVSERVSLWRMSLDMAADHPIVGAGPDAFPQLFASYRTQDQAGFHTRNVRPESSHDIVLDRLVDTGGLGLAAFLTLIGSVLWLGLRALRRADAAQRTVIAALIAGAVAYYIAALFYYAEPAAGWMPWLLLGAIAGTSAVVAADEPPEAPRAWTRWASSEPVRWSAAALGAVLVAGGLLLVGADYASGRAYKQAARGDMASAAGTAHTATRLDPLLPQYWLALGNYRDAQAQRGDPGAWPQALAAYQRTNSWFGATASGLAKEAEAQANVAFSTPQERDVVFALLERAVAADPNNADVRQGVADFYSSVGEDARAAPHRAWLAQARAAGDAPPP